MLIGLSGKAGVGKTTVADMLAKKLGGKRVSFADALREEVTEYFDLGTLVGTREGKEVTVTMGLREMTVREVLQWWGNLRRETDYNYWVDVIDKLHRDMIYRCTREKTLEQIWIVDDVRFTNEAELIELGALFRIEPYPAWIKNCDWSDHPSETELDAYPEFGAIYKPKFGELEKVAKDIAKNVKIRLGSNR